MALENDPQNSTEQLNKLKKDFEEFVYIISHDLKAPLRAIKNLSEWIEEDVGSQIDGEVKNNFELLRSRVDWMNKMIDGLLEYSRVCSRTRVIQSVNIRNSIHQTVGELFIPQNVNVIIEATDQEFFADPTQVKKVLEHLIQNAIKFNKNKSPMVTIKAEKVANGLELSVADNGLGINHKSPQLAFEVLKTLHGEEKMYSLGIGLAIVKKVIEDIGGIVKLETVSDEGTTVEIFWPDSTQ